MEDTVDQPLDTAARLLRLLSLLQLRRDWAGADLAERLDMTGRTIRRDVERLRSLGYPVHATPGVDGGYRLGAGGALPPLLLDEDESVAVAIGLRTAAGHAVTDLGEPAVRALAKLERMLPSRLRHRVAALQASTVALKSPTPAVQPAALVAIAAACRGCERLRFGYHDSAERGSERLVEPHRLVHTGRRWYLVARDTGREAWRTFRVDRMDEPVATGSRFTPEETPDAAAFVADAVTSAPYRYRAQVRLHAPATTIAEQIPPTVGVIDAVDEQTCVLTAGGDSLDAIAMHLALLEVEFEVLEPPELVDHVGHLAGRLSRAVPRSAPGTGQSGR